MDCFDKNDFENGNKSHKLKENHRNKEKFVEKKKDKKLNDYISMKSHQDDNDSLSSYPSRTSEISQHSILSKHSLQSIVDLPNHKQKKQKKNLKKKHSKNLRNKKILNETPSIHSLYSQTNKFIPLTDSENKLNKSYKNNRIDNKQDERSISSTNNDSNLSIDSFHLNDDYDKKPIESKQDNRSTPYHIEYPGKKNSHDRKHVEKCLNFYQNIRKYFDDDVAAMLLKCCLCYNHCSIDK
ncbi:unnamed protein product [Rotaria sp. Silwood1]|nr:unnamed protein product [Rotaria sp. Silwood1]